MMEKTREIVCMFCLMSIAISGCAQKSGVNRTKPHGQMFCIEMSGPALTTACTLGDKLRMDVGPPSAAKGKSKGTTMLVDFDSGFSAMITHDRKEYDDQVLSSIRDQMMKHKAAYEKIVEQSKESERQLQKTRYESGQSSGNASKVKDCRWFRLENTAQVAGMATLEDLCLAKYDAATITAYVGLAATLRQFHKKIFPATVQGVPIPNVSSPYYLRDGYIETKSLPKRSLFGPVAHPMAATYKYSFKPKPEADFFAVPKGYSKRDFLAVPSKQ